MGRHATLQRWIYGSGDFGFSLTYTIVDAYFAIFLTDLVGIKPAVAAAAIFIDRTSDYLNDPLTGYLLSGPTSWISPSLASGSQ